MSGASSPGRVRKNAPASGMLEVSGPRPSFASSSKFSGVERAEERRLVGLVVELAMQWSCRLWPTGRFSRTSMPKSSRSSAGPMPEIISSTGDW